MVDLWAVSARCVLGKPWGLITTTVQQEQQLDWLFGTRLPGPKMKVPDTRQPSNERGVCLVPK